jgi:hypothetical protein
MEGETLKSEAKEEEKRLSEIVESGRNGGEMAKHGGDRKSTSSPATRGLKDLGLDDRRLSEASDIARLSEDGRLTLTAKHGILAA